jgi:hypothetical protein
LLPGLRKAQRGILRLYRITSACRLLYADGPHENDPAGPTYFYHPIFNDYKASSVQNLPQEMDGLNFHEFLQDMILLYRLIFGMNQKSRKAFKAEFENWRRGSLHDGFFGGLLMYDMDRLLWLLCTDPGSSPEHKNLLNLLDGEETSSRYSFDDFPFLGSGFFSDVH